MQRHSFTLVELLIVMAILAFLTSMSLFVIKPKQLFEKARDMRRLADAENLDNSIQTILFESPDFNLGTINVVYLSLKDASSSCGSFSTQLPSLPTGWSYRCSAVPEKTDGTGWLPINFTNIPPATLDTLPVDPRNNPPFYYTYTAKSGGDYELTLYPENEKNRGATSTASQDDGDDIYVFELGSNKTLTPFLAQSRKPLKIVNVGSNYTASQAENYCKSTYGSDYQLFIPHSQAELNATWYYINGNSAYLTILGIYPKYQGASCVNTAMTSQTCTSWRAGDNTTFWVSTRTDITEPNGDNCTICSMNYSWNSNGTISWYNDWRDYYTSSKFICQIKPY